MVVHHVVPLATGMQGAKERMKQRIHVFRAERGQSHQPHVSEMGLLGSEVGTAVDGDIMSHFGKATASFFVVRFDPAITRNYATPSDEGDL